MSRVDTSYLRHKKIGCVACLNDFLRFFCHQETLLTRRPCIISVNRIEVQSSGGHGKHACTKWPIQSDGCIWFCTHASRTRLQAVTGFHRGQTQKPTSHPAVSALKICISSKHLRSEVRKKALLEIQWQNKVRGDKVRGKPTGTFLQIPNV